MFDLSFGGSQSKTKNKTFIDGRTSDAQWANYDGARTGLLPSYAPTSADQIQQFQNPYTDQVVDRSLGALERSRQMAVGQIGDAATAAHSFGGSRHGVAEAETNRGYAEQSGLLSANLYQSSYAQALQAAMEEQRRKFDYPLQRQGLLNQTIQTVTPTVFSLGKQTQFSGGFKGSFGQPAPSAG